MEWAPSDRARIATHLGYGFSPGELQTIQFAMDKITADASDVIETIQTQLRAIETVSAAIAEAAPFAGASFTSGPTGSRQFFKGERMSELKGEGRRATAILSQMLNLPIKRDIFSSGNGTARIIRG